MREFHLLISVMKIFKERPPRRKEREMRRNIFYGTVNL
jgi:hypothetical protein